MPCDSAGARLRSVATRKANKTGNATGRLGRNPMSLKRLAGHLVLSPPTVSLVINRSNVGDSIPQDTKDTIIAAARKFNYRPNFLARSPRSQRSFAIGVIVPGVSDGYSATVMGGVEGYLCRRDISILSPATGIGPT